MHRVEMRPPATPDEAGPLEHRDNLRGNAVDICRHSLAAPAPEPIIRIPHIDIDRGAPGMHAGLASIGTRTASIGSAQRIKILPVLRWKFVQLPRYGVQLPIHA